YPSYINGYEFLKENNGVSGLYFRVEDTKPAISSDVSSFLTFSNAGSAASSGGFGPKTLGMLDASGTLVSSNLQNLPVLPKFYIGTGIGFFVDVPSTAQTLKFTNAMRLSAKDLREDGGLFSSSKSSVNKVKKVTNSQFNRIWLNMTDDKTSNFSQALVGYMDNASNGLDIGYDTRVFGMNKYALYSLMDGVPSSYTIQGRALPFENSDVVPLGYMITTNGKVNISLDSVDGLFSSNSQNIFLEDMTLGVIQDLKLGSYTFDSNAGTFNNRFNLRYETTLAINTLNDVINSVLVTNNNKQIVIKSLIEPIEKVVFYDVLGRMIFVKSNINNNEFSVKELNLSHQTLIVKITLTSGQVVTKKLVY
ncbi:MAG: hypothetical protein C0412_18460, partial [Flavobacterium sp.]|nr:hypothetical protein [Flavobacterium sp.]